MNKLEDEEARTMKTRKFQIGDHVKIRDTEAVRNAKWGGFPTLPCVGRIGHVVKYATHGKYWVEFGEVGEETYGGYFRVWDLEYIPSIPGILLIEGLPHNGDKTWAATAYEVDRYFREA